MYGRPRMRRGPLIQAPAHASRICRLTVRGGNKPSPRALLSLRLNRLSVFHGSALMINKSPVVDFKATGARDTKPS
jgi:hypothetical protein